MQKHNYTMNFNKECMKNNLGGGHCKAHYLFCPFFKGWPKSVGPRAGP